MALHHLAPAEKAQLAVPISDIGARAVALVKTDMFEAAQLVLAAGASIARHSVRGYVTILCIEGKVVLDTTEPIELTAGEWLYLDRGQAHSLQASEDSVLLLTVLFEQHR